MGKPKESSSLGLGTTDLTGKPAVATLVMTFGYGSARDLDVLRVDLCNEAAEEVLALLQSK